MSDLIVKGRVRLPPVRSLSKTCPSASEVKEARLLARMTMKEAASSVYIPTSTWDRFEQGELLMHPAIAELFYIKNLQNKE